jgi:GMP synthase-like glutamine amidotransferase
MLTIMGGPMSVNDEARLPWLSPELALTCDAIAAKKTVLGICLGAQMIAKASGSRVYRGAEKEIGWFTVQRLAASGTVFDGLPDRFIPLHWHGETFDLPNGAQRLAETDVVPNQAFAIGSHVLGLQFHLEATPESVLELVGHAAHEIGDGPFEQHPEAIRAGTAHCAALQPLLLQVLDRLTGLLPEGT